MRAEVRRGEAGAKETQGGKGKQGKHMKQRESWQIHDSFLLWYTFGGTIVVLGAVYFICLGLFCYVVMVNAIYLLNALVCQLNECNVKKKKRPCKTN